MIEEQITARKLVLVDANDKPRIVLDATTVGPRIQMATEQGKIRLTLLLDDKGVPHIALHDSQGKMRLRLAVTERTLPEDETRPFESLKTQEAPSVFLTDSNGVLSLSMEVQDDRPAVVLRNSKGEGVVAIVVQGKDYEPMMSMKNPEGEVAVDLGIGEQGEGKLGLRLPPS